MTTLRPINVQDVFNIAEFETLAASMMTVAVRDLANAGAGDGRAIRANRAAWEAWALRSRILRDVSACDLSTTLLGTPISLPLLIAPSGLHGLVHPDAEAATARATRRADTLMVLSMNSSLCVEDVAQEQANLWFQLYWGPERDFLADLIMRAAEAGCKALCLTLDMPVRPWVLGPMRRALTAIGDVQPAHGFPRKGHLDAGARWDHDARLTWNDLAWLRDKCPLPIVLKGIMTAEDAAMAADHGVGAIIVSNHGGRLLEEGLATAEALPEIVSAVDGRIDVLVDGGIRTGSDIIKALALGARAALIGRPILWALAVDGSGGVDRVFELLRNEMRSIMGMIGLSSLAEIDSECVVRRDPSVPTPMRH